MDPAPSSLGAWAFALRAVLGIAEIAKSYGVGALFDDYGQGDDQLLRAPRRRRLKSDAQITACPCGWGDVRPPPHPRGLPAACGACGGVPFTAFRSAQRTLLGTVDTATGRTVRGLRRACIVGCQRCVVNVAQHRQQVTSKLLGEDGRNPSPTGGMWRVRIATVQRESLAQERLADHLALWVVCHPTAAMDERVAQAGVGGTAPPRAPFHES